MRKPYRQLGILSVGIGFNITTHRNTSRGTGYNIHPEVARRLHRGDFSIQATFDLHGLIAEDAKEVFEKFLKCSVITGKRGVLIISRPRPFIPYGTCSKEKGRRMAYPRAVRKWVVAYASARSCDGGAGATYVLLRQRPVSKRSKTR